MLIRGKTAAILRVISKSQTCHLTTLELGDAVGCTGTNAQRCLRILKSHKFITTELNVNGRPDQRSKIISEQITPAGIIALIDAQTDSGQGRQGWSDHNPLPSPEWTHGIIYRDYPELDCKRWL